ncbi:hypothetical protein EV04_0951 [Prochlorococcus marinus str. LG]|nr:hypothetical protein EV04_0951 [Prochlorococcus marinus str. LG]
MLLITKNSSWFLSRYLYAFECLVCLPESFLESIAIFVLIEGIQSQIVINLTACNKAIAGLMQDSASTTLISLMLPGVALNKDLFDQLQLIVYFKVQDSSLLILME